MIETMGNAKRSLNFLSYLYWSGEIACEIADALCAAAARGVEVNVLLDAVGSAKMDRDLVRKMGDAGVTFAYFRPPKPYAIRRVNNRTHRKLLIADGEVGMTGGVGIADQWTGHAQDPDHWRDTHVRVRGPIVRGLQGAFAENWLEATGDVLVGPDYLPELRAGRRRRRDAGRPLDGGGRRHERRGAVLPGDRLRAQDAAPHVGVLRAAAGVHRGADRRRAARRRRPGARPRAAHRQGLRPPGGPLGLRGAARGRRADLRVLPDDDPRQDADDRRRLVVGRLGELRQPLLPAAGRGDALRLLARVRGRARRAVRTRPRALGGDRASGAGTAGRCTPARARRSSASRGASCSATGACPAASVRCPRLLGGSKALLLPTGGAP